MKMGPLRLNNETQIVAYGPRFVIYQHEHEGFENLLYGFCKLYDFFIDNPSNVRNQPNQDRMSVRLFFRSGSNHGCFSLVTTFQPWKREMKSDCKCLVKTFLGGMLTLEFQ
jgi:hypothetical protein